MSNGYQPGHDAFVAWKVESATGASTSSYGTWDSSDNPTLPAAPSSPVYAGYLMNAPTTTDSYNNKKGTAVGSYLPLYDADGAVQFEIQVQFAIGSIALIEKCLRDGTGLYGLPDICLFVGQSNVNGIGYTDVYRYCKCNTLQIQLQSGSAQELMCTATFWPLARQTGSVLTPTREQHQALGEPLFWHDVRDVTLGATNRRRTFMGGSITVNHNLERKELRPHAGQSDPTSLIPYEIMPHMQTVEGDLTLHAQLAETFYTSGTLPRRWGDLTFGINDEARQADPEDAKYFNLTLENVVPMSRSKGGQEASAEIQYTVPYIADDLTISTDAPA